MFVYQLDAVLVGCFALVQAPPPDFRAWPLAFVNAMNGHDELGKK